MANSKYHDRTELGPVIYFSKKEEPYGFLSQWFPKGFEDPDFPNIYFPTAEHYMHFNKAILMGDVNMAKEILDVPVSEPSAAYFAGKAVKPFKSDVWDQHKDKIVLKANYLKFSNPANADIRGKLLLLKDHLFVHCSPQDPIWGIGFILEQAKASNPGTWGQNKLGLTLMAVCSAISEEAGDGANGKQPSQAGPSRPMVPDDEDGMEERNGEDNDNSSVSSNSNDSSGSDEDDGGDEKDHQMSARGFRSDDHGYGVLPEQLHPGSHLENTDDGDIGMSDAGRDKDEDAADQGDDDPGNGIAKGKRALEDSGNEEGPPQTSASRTQGSSQR
ncbi:hypothetical protein PG987_004952 [Apiospora arundinis]